MNEALQYQLDLPPIDQLGFVVPDLAGTFSRVLGHYVRGTQLLAQAQCALFQPAAQGKILYGKTYQLVD